jgi:hypothetical protein
MKTKRYRERECFQQFHSAYGLEGVPIYGDKPDVIIKSSRTIGVEITNFYLASGDDETSEQRQRPRRAKVIADAQALHRAAGGRRTALTITFNPQKPITVARQRLLTQDLADLAHRVDAQRIGEVRSDLFGALPEVSRVWFNPEEYADAKWSDAQVYSPDFLEPKSLQEIVAQKESKAAEYLPCDAYWLLVVVEFADPAQDQEIRGLRLKLPSSVFEKIIVYKTVTGDFLEVKN